MSIFVCEAGMSPEGESAKGDPGCKENFADWEIIINFTENYSLSAILSFDRQRRSGEAGRAIGA